MENCIPWTWDWEPREFIPKAMTRRRLVDLLRTEIERLETLPEDDFLVWRNVHLHDFPQPRLHLDLVRTSLPDESDTKPASPPPPFQVFHGPAPQRVPPPIPSPAKDRRAQDVTDSGWINVRAPRRTAPTAVGKVAPVSHQPVVSPYFSTSGSQARRQHYARQQEHVSDSPPPLSPMISPCKAEPAVASAAAAAKSRPVKSTETEPPPTLAYMLRVLRTDEFVDSAEEIEPFCDPFDDFVYAES